MLGSGDAVNADLSPGDRLLAAIASAPPFRFRSLQDLATRGQLGRRHNTRGGRAVVVEIIGVIKRARPVCRACGLVKGVGWPHPAARPRDAGRLLLTITQPDPYPRAPGVRARGRWFCSQECEQFDAWRSHHEIPLGDI